MKFVSSYRTYGILKAGKWPNLDPFLLQALEKSRIEALLKYVFINL